MPPVQRVSLVWAVAALTTIGTSYMLVAQDADWERLLKQEAPERWKTYIAKMESLQGNWREYRVENRQQHTVMETTIKRNGACRLCIISRYSNEGAASEVTLTAYNPNYSFQLSMSKTGSAWQLLWIRSRSGNGQERLEPDEAYRWLSRLCISPACVSRIDYTFDAPVYRIVSIGSEKASSGATRVRVDFDWVGGPGTPSTLLKRGSVLLDPGHYWIILSGIFFFEGQAERLVQRAKKEIRFDYRSTADGLLLPTALIECHHNETTGKQVITKREFNLEEGETRLEEFWVSHYGLIEPADLGTIKITPWWLYILITGFLLAALALIIYRVRTYVRCSHLQ